MCLMCTLDCACFFVSYYVFCVLFCFFFFFQAEDGIRDLVRSRGLGDVYKRQASSRRDLMELHGDAVEVDI